MTLSIDKSTVARHFGRHAANYDRVTPVQREMGQELLRQTKLRLNGISPRQILELGCGTGVLTERLRHEFPDALITAVDLSPEMIHCAVKRMRASCGHEANIRLGLPCESEMSAPVAERLPTTPKKQPPGHKRRDLSLRKRRSQINPTGGIEFVIADAEIMADAIPRSHGYDLIITNATVQWFNNPVHTLTNWITHLNDSGIISFSTFGNQTFHELKASFGEAEKLLGLPPGRWTLSLPDCDYWQQQLKNDKFGALSLTDNIRLGYYQSPQELLRTIRDSGATIAYANRPQMSRRLFAAMSEIYKRRFTDPESQMIVATYHEIIAVFHKL